MLVLHSSSTTVVVCCRLRGTTTTVCCCTLFGTEEYDRLLLLLLKMFVCLPSVSIVSRCRSFNWQERILTSFNASTRQGRGGRGEGRGGRGRGDVLLLRVGLVKLGCSMNIHLDVCPTICNRLFLRRSYE